MKIKIKIGLILFSLLENKIGTQFIFPTGK